MPTSVKNKAEEFFHWQDHQRADEDLHEAIIEDGDHAKAESVSRKVAKRLGLSDADIDALTGKTERVKRRLDWATLKARSAVVINRLQKFDPDQPRDEDGQWTDGGGGSGGGGGDAGAGGGFTSTTPAEFIAARNQSARPQYLSPLEPTDLSDHTLLLNNDKTVGAAIDPQGDLQNVFNNGGAKGAAGDVIVEAIGKGARTLDCYDGYLNDYYHQFGFVETGRIKFNPEFAHGWDVNKHGTPDVVFMAWKGYLNGGEKAAIERAKAPREKWLPNEASSKYATDYDAAKAESRTHASGKGHHRGTGEKPRAPADGAGDQPRARSGEGDRQPLTKFDPDQPRDEDGRWSDGGSGGGAKPADKPAKVPGYKPGFKTPKTGLDFHHSDAVKQNWIAQSPIKTIDDVKRLANDSQQALGEAGRQIAGKLGIAVKDPGSKVKSEKGVKRVIEKAAEPRYGSLAAVPDVARISFLIDHPEQSDQILDELAKRFEVAGEPWKLTDVNYADRAANVRLPNGMMGEIQMMEPHMAQAKSPDGGGGHNYYVIAREADPKQGIKPDAEKYAAATAKMSEIYGKVLDQLGPDWKALFGKGGKAPKFF
jgi:hypothetical protein